MIHPWNEASRTGRPVQVGDPEPRRVPCSARISLGRTRLATTQRRYRNEEFARRGDAIYEKDILPKLAAKDVGKFVAIDIETGAYAIASDEMKAGDQLRRRLPDAQIWMVRIGYTSTRGFGGRPVRQESP
jgi:hypothetical protein